MKKIYSLLLLIVIGVSAINAETQDTTRHNNFGACRDNWYIEVAGGANILFSKDARLNYNEKNLTPYVSLAAGKWFTPYIGGRLQIEGYKANSGSDGSGNFLSDKIASGFGNTDPVRDNVSIRPDGSYVYPVYFINAHVDMTMSILSLAKHGFSNKDHWDVIPSVGVGYSHVFDVNGVPATNTFTAHFGIMCKYRIIPELDINIFANTTLFPDMYEGRLTGSVVDPLFAFGGSLTYNINGHNFTGKRVAPKALKKKKESKQVFVDNSALEQKIDELSKQVAEAKANEKGEEQKNYFNYNIIAGSEESAKQLNNKVVGSILFQLGTTTPISEVNNQLVNVSELLKAFPNAKIQVEGYADKATGSAELNQKLSEDRANYVADMLKKNYNIPEEKIIIKAFGGTQKAYDSTDSEQRAVLLRIIF